MPPLQVDPAYAPKALAVFLADARDDHADERAIRVWSSIPAATSMPSRALVHPELPTGMGRLHIEYAAAKRPSGWWHRSPPPGQAPR